MRRVRFVIPPSGPLLVTGARVALANARFAQSRQGHFILRALADDTRILPDLGWLGVVWDSIGEPGDRDGAIAYLKSTGRLYPCFEAEVELNAKREQRLRRGKSAVYDRAMLKMTQAQREQAEAGGKRPYWRFRLSNRVLTGMDAIAGRWEAKLPATSDPVLVAADGTVQPALAAVVDDVADRITHVLRADDGAAMTGIHIDLLDALGQNSAAVTFARLPALGETGRLAIRNLRADGIEAETLTAWLGCGERFNIRQMEAIPDPVDLPARNRAVLARRAYAAVADRLPAQATEPFWLAIRGHIDLLNEARHWWDVVDGAIFPPIPEGARPLLDAALAALPGEPWDGGTWEGWLGALPPEAGPVLRRVLTGEDHGPELQALLPLIGRARVLERLRGG